MRIVQVLASSGGVGGLEQHTFNLANQLSLTEDVHVIAHPCYAVHFNAQVHFHAVDFSRSRWNIKLLWQLKSLINEIDADIVHAQAGKAAQLMARIKAFLNPIHTVTTIHGTKKQKSAYLIADAVIAVSQALTAGIPEDQVHVVYNGVYPQITLSAQEKQKLKQSIFDQDNKIDQSKKIVMCVGRLEPVKNIALLIEAMQGIDAQLWIVGDGSLRATLQTQVQQLNLNKQVFFLGYRADARDLIQLADLVVLSSKREGFPLVMVEALQANKVMVSTKVNGVVEWLPKNYLADIGDANGLRCAIQFGLDMQAYVEFNALFERAKQKLTVEAMAEQTLVIYHQLLDYH